MRITVLILYCSGVEFPVGRCKGPVRPRICLAVWGIQLYARIQQNASIPETRTEPWVQLQQALMCNGRQSHWKGRNERQGRVSITVYNLPFISLKHVLNQKMLSRKPFGRGGRSVGLAKCPINDLCFHTWTHIGKHPWNSFYIFRQQRNLLHFGDEHNLCFIFCKEIYCILEMSIISVLFSAKWLIFPNFIFFCSNSILLHLWHCGPFWALASLRRLLHSSVSSALLLCPCIPRICDMSLQVMSSHLVFLFPAGLLFVQIKPMCFIIHVLKFKYPTQSTKGWIRLWEFLEL